MFSSALTFNPEGAQEELLTEDMVRPLHDDILIARLAPNQEIDLLGTNAKLDIQPMS